MSAATPESTRARAGRFLSRGFSSASYRVLGRTGLSVSALGFGAYRVDETTPEHRLALIAALRDGCNLIDTSTNYTDGESESLIGATVESLTGSPDLSREELVVVSKIGYVQGRNLELAIRCERSGDPFPDMVKFAPGCWHCIHPRFLEDQLDRSLARLRLDRLEVCLLHNPEYFLEQAHRQGVSQDRARSEFYARISAAFAHFEREVARGRIAWYGVSSNSFGAPPEDPESTSLGLMLEAAESAAREAGLDPAEHHFAVAQLPLNLFEHGPYSVRKEGSGKDLSTLAFAQERSIGVLVNRPLNAFAGGALIRLADFHPDRSGPSVIGIASAARSQERGNPIAAAIDPFLPEAIRTQSLSRKALLAIASVEGVTCVLNGMRQPRYVTDSLEVLRWERLPGAERLFLEI